MRSIVTTLLEVLGILALDAAGFVILAPIALPLALGVIGVLLVAESAALTWMEGRE